VTHYNGDIRIQQCGWIRNLDSQTKEFHKRQVVDAFGEQGLQTGSLKCQVAFARWMEKCSTRAAVKNKVTKAIGPQGALVGQHSDNRKNQRQPSWIFKRPGQLSH
jgi:hypothetical protein